MSVHLDSYLAMGLMLRRRIDEGHPFDQVIEEFCASAIQSRRPYFDEDSRNRRLVVVSQALAALGWAEAAFAAVTVGHRLAASLVMTSIPHDYVSEIIPPWNAFCIHVPAGLIPEVDFVLVSKALDTWSLIAQGGRGATRETGSHSFATLLRSDSELYYDNGASGLPEDYVVGIENRSLAVRRLIAGVCLEFMSTPTLNPHKHGTSIKTKRGEPRTWTYTLGRSVRFDARAAVSDFLSGDAKRVHAVQSLVRGHQKRQSHGPGGALRKWIHVEPYWRGPEDAPIATRQHVMGSTS